MRETAKIKKKIKFKDIDYGPREYLQQLTDF